MDKKRKRRRAREDAIDSVIATQRLQEEIHPWNSPGWDRAMQTARVELGEQPQVVVLVGDIVSGFEAYGPFDTGHDAITWKQSAGNRESCQGQWYLMQLKPPIPGKD